MEFGICMVIVGYRVFKVTRMQSLELGGNSFVKKEIPIEKSIENRQLVREKITIIFNRNQLAFISDYFTQDEIIEITEATVKVVFEFKHDYEFINLLLYFGSGIIDIEPKRYKEKYKEKLNQMIQQL